MSASTATAAGVLARPAGPSRIYGLGSIFAKSLRDSRRATLLAGIGVGLIVLAPPRRSPPSSAPPKGGPPSRRCPSSCPPSSGACWASPSTSRRWEGSCPGDTELRAGHPRGLVDRGALGHDRHRSTPRQHGPRRSSPGLPRPDRDPEGRRPPRLDDDGGPDRGGPHLAGHDRICDAPRRRAAAPTVLSHMAWLGLASLGPGSWRGSLAPVMGRGAAAGIGALVCSSATSSSATRRRSRPSNLGPLSYFSWTAGHRPMAGVSDWSSLGLLAGVEPCCSPRACWCSAPATSGSR